MASHLVSAICCPASNNSLLIPRRLQANIFGTEQDRVNCSFYYKVRLPPHPLILRRLNAL